MCNCETTFTISGPDAALQNRYGQNIVEIKDAFEQAIARSYIDTEDDSTPFVRVETHVDDVLRPMFTRMYESAGWPSISYRYIGEVRLYFPLP